MMSEYGAYPLWIVETNGLRNVEAHTVDVPSSLAVEIEALGDSFEATFVADDPALSGFRNDAERERFMDNGMRLFDNLKAALAGLYLVEYHALDGLRHR